LRGRARDSHQASSLAWTPRARPPTPTPSHNSLDAPKRRPAWGQRTPPGRSCHRYRRPPVGRAAEKDGHEKKRNLLLLDLRRDEAHPRCWPGARTAPQPLCEYPRRQTHHPESARGKGKRKGSTAACAPDAQRGRGSPLDPAPLGTNTTAYPEHPQVTAALTALLTAVTTDVDGDIDAQHVVQLRHGHPDAARHRRGARPSPNAVGLALLEAPAALWELLQ
jgi:hypothetical protein